MTEAAAANEVLQLVEQLNRITREDQLGQLYQAPAPPGQVTGGPYPWAVEFHNAGATEIERLIMAGNRVGKTHTAAAEVAIHATGLYPPWWRGHRFKTPIRAWVGAETNEAGRDICQRALLGDASEIGTGWIPKECIGDIEYRQAGIADVVDYVRVRHASGGWSRIVFKTYEQGRRKWQGTSQHLIWCDEEPPGDIYSEALTRTLDVRGRVIVTFTPLQGVSDVVHKFMESENNGGVWMCNVTWDDAPHLDGEEKERLWNSFPAHERETRAKGIPMAGSGLIYGTPDDDLMIDSFPIPPYWRRIVGIDFGIDHPFAAVWIAHDPDTDTVYVTDCYRKKGEVFSYHASAINQRAAWIPVAWPHDGMQREKSSGKNLADQMRAHGVNTCPLSARYDDDKGGGQPREPVVWEIDERMRDGRFKVFAHLGEWFQEKRMFHREDNLIVPKRDDLMSATEYAVMMKRFARTHRDVEAPRMRQVEAVDPFASL